ncbi:MAG: hypothetical protein A2V66_04240 [Ignavibacteria bacterium RBG_13_36_8]|nr:MAG: hypothetical protein A2V66_04240 [Ignavibacteria bacterium RBG_13_36_8]
MGFLRKLNLYLFNIFIIFFLFGCTKPLIVKNVLNDQPCNRMFGGIPQRDFYIPQNLSDSLSLKWIAETQGNFSNTSVVIYDSLLFTADLSGRIYAFSTTTGKILGDEKYKGAIAAAPLLYMSRLIFVLNEFDEYYSTLIIFDYYTGKKIHETEIPGKVNNELILLNNGIMVLTEKGEVIKYNLVGYKEWSISTKSLSLGSPALKDNIFVFGNMDGELVAVDIDNQKIKYRKKLSEGFSSGISISGNYGFIGDKNGNLYCIDLNRGNTYWIFNTGILITSIPVTDGASVFCGNIEGDIYSINLSNGKMNWKINTEGAINAPPLVFNNYLVQPDINKKVHIIAKQNGQIIRVLEFEKRVKMCPVFFDNTLYFGVDDGEIYAYEIVE